MNIRKLWIAVFLTISLPVAADFTTIAEAYEVPMNLFNVPVTRNGTLSLQQCTDCPVVTARLTPQTQFLVNGQLVELSEFRQQAFAVSDRASKTVVVLHHLETDTISSISLNL
jgi:hypothetical protein